MSTGDHELDIEDDGLATAEAALAALRDAIDLASDQDQVTWLTENGKRIAAIAPVDLVEQLLQRDDAVQELMARAFRRPG